MRMSEEMADYVAGLAMLELDREERREMAGELEKILDYMAALDSLDTAHAPPPGPVLPLKNVLRPDEPAPSLPREELLACASARDGEYFLTPRAVE